MHSQNFLDIDSVSDKLLIFSLVLKKVHIILIRYHLFVDVFWKLCSLAHLILQLWRDTICVVNHGLDLVIAKVLKRILEVLKVRLHFVLLLYCASENVRCADTHLPLRGGYGFVDDFWLALWMQHCVFISTYFFYEFYCTKI